MIKYISKFNIWRHVYNSMRVKSTLSEHKQLNSKINHLEFESKVPQNYVKDKPEKLEPIKIDEKTINLLEQLSLVDCANKQGIETLQDAILFANKVLQINTDNIDPMYTVLEHSCLNLRDDEVIEGNIQQDVLKNAAITEEDYFVAPPGNIPLQPRNNLLHK